MKKLNLRQPEQAILTPEQRKFRAFMLSSAGRLQGPLPVRKMPMKNTGFEPYELRAMRAKNGVGRRAKQTQQTPSAAVASPHPAQLMGALTDRPVPHSGALIPGGSRRLKQTSKEKIND